MAIKKTIVILTIITFIFSNAAYGAPRSRSIFKGKKVDYKKLSTQSEEELQKKKAVLKDGKEGGSVKEKKDTQRVSLSRIGDLSGINIPPELGKIIEVYQAPNPNQYVSTPLIVHIQDLHTNPEAQLNAASILELFIKDYNLNLVCSEGAEGEVDTSSVSSFPDYEVREKTARLFINSGELTGEEYVSITKYPELPIWGIEDKDIYFKHILEFNKIMKFSDDAQSFIGQVKGILEELKPKVYSKKLLEIDKKQGEYEESNIDTNQYLDYLLTLTPFEKMDSRGKENIILFRKSLDFEKGLSQEKVKQESQNILMALQAVLRGSQDDEMQALLAKASLFKEEKIAPYSFYSYLDELGRKYLKEDLDKYQNVINFAGYLKEVNSLDTIKLFNEVEELTYEIKDSLSRDENQLLLTKSLRHIKLLETFFNLKLSNEELDYYNANKEELETEWFKSTLPKLAEKDRRSRDKIGTIDFNPDLIDRNFPEVENFYVIARKRDKAMVSNTIEQIEKRKVKIAAVITGGFHTQGITKLFKEKGYSYIVIAPYSSTEIDEENYKFLLSGKRRPLSELIEKLNEGGEEKEE